MPNARLPHAAYPEYPTANRLYKTGRDHQTAEPAILEKVLSNEDGRPTLACGSSGEMRRFVLEATIGILIIRGNGHPSFTFTSILHSN